MSATTLGTVLYSFFEDHLKAVKGLRSASIASYRDALRLFLLYVAADARRRISRLALADLTFERVQGFLRHLEAERSNRIGSRNQRLAVLHGFFDYLAVNDPAMLALAQRVAAIPAKRSPPPETCFLHRSQVETLFRDMSGDDWTDRRDRTLLLFLYNTGARVQEVADLQVANLDFGPPPRVHLHGKGDKWRSCPLWQETSDQLRRLLDEPSSRKASEASVFVSRGGTALTRFGIYKIVRRRTSRLALDQSAQGRHWISPHVLRHTTAVHLLEAGVEVNVIRGWLGHVSLDTTNRYAEITIRAKEEALRACLAPTGGAAFPRKPVWRDDDALLKWLRSL